MEVQGSANRINQDLNIGNINSAPTEADGNPIDDQLKEVHSASERQEISTKMKDGAAINSQSSPTRETQESPLSTHTEVQSKEEQPLFTMTEKDFSQMLDEEVAFINESVKSRALEEDLHPEIQKVKVELLQKVRNTKPADALKKMSQGFGVSRQNQTKIALEADKPSVKKALKTPDHETKELFKSVNMEANKEAFETYNTTLVDDITGARKSHIKESLSKIQKKVPHPIVIESVIDPLKSSPLEHQKAEAQRDIEAQSNSEVLHGLNQAFKTGESQAETGLGDENYKENSKLREGFRQTLKGNYKSTLLGRPLKALGGILGTGLAALGIVKSPSRTGAIVSAAVGAGAIVYSGYQISHSEGSKRYSGMGLFQGETPGHDLKALSLKDNPEFKGTKYEEKSADENSKFFARCFRFSKNQKHGEKVSKARIFFGRLAAHHSTRSIAPKWIRPLTALIGTTLSVGLIAPLAYNIYRSAKETEEIDLAINHSPNEPIIDPKTGESKPNFEAKRLRALTETVIGNYKTEFKANVKANATSLVNQVYRNARDAALSVVGAGKRVIKGVQNGVNNVQFLAESLEKSVDKLDQATAEAIHHFQGDLKTIQDKMSVAIFVHQAQLSNLIDMTNQQPIGSPIYNKLMGEIMDISNALEKRIDMLKQEASSVMDYLLNGARDDKGHHSYRFSYNDETGKKHNVKFKGIRWQLNRIIKWKADANTLFRDNASFQNIQRDVENITGAFAHIGTQQNFLNSSLALMLADQQLAGVETILDALASDLSPDQAGSLQTYTNALESLKTNLEKSLQDYQKTSDPKEFPGKLQSVKHAIAEFKKALSDENKTFESLKDGSLNKKLGDYKLSQYFQAINTQLDKLSKLADGETGMIVEAKTGSGASIEARAEYISGTDEGYTYEASVLSETLMRGMANFTGEIKKAFGNITESKAWLQGFDTQLSTFNEFQKHIVQAFDKKDFHQAGKELQGFILTFNSGLEVQKQRLTKDQQEVVGNLFGEMKGLATNLTTEIKRIVEAELGGDLPELQIKEENATPQEQKIGRAEKALEGNMSAQIGIAEELAQDRGADLEDLKAFYEHTLQGLEQVMTRHKIKPEGRLKTLNALEKFWTGFASKYTEGHFDDINAYLLEAQKDVINSASNKEIGKVIENRMSHVVQQLALYASDGVETGEITDFSSYNAVAQTVVDQKFPSLKGAQVTSVEFMPNSRTFRLAVTHKGTKYNMQFMAPIFPPSTNGLTWESTINLSNPEDVARLTTEIIPGIEGDLQALRKEDVEAYEKCAKPFKDKENTQFFLHRAKDQKSGLRFRTAKHAAKAGLTKDLRSQGTYFDLYMTLAKTLLHEMVPQDTVQAVAEKQVANEDIGAEEMLRNINDANIALWKDAKSLKKTDKKGQSKETVLKNPRLFVALKMGKLQYSLLRDSNAAIGSKVRETSPEEIGAKSQVDEILQKSPAILDFIKRYNGGSLEGIELLFEKDHPLRVVISNDTHKGLAEKLRGLFGSHIEVIRPSKQKKSQMAKPYTIFTANQS